MRFVCGVLLLAFTEPASASLITEPRSYRIERYLAALEVERADRQIRMDGLSIVTDGKTDVVMRKWPPIVWPSTPSDMRVFYGTPDAQWSGDPPPAPRPPPGMTIRPKGAY
jgi:hypothetical protein